jgi:hypothetical protein
MGAASYHYTIQPLWIIVQGVDNLHDFSRPDRCSTVVVVTSDIHGTLAFPEAHVYFQDHVQAP